MLPKQNRVTQKEISEIWEKGRFVSSPNLSFKFLGSENSTSRISFTVPKTVSKKAVVRNLLRRRGYSILKKHIPTLPPLVGMVVFGKNSLEAFGGKKNKAYSPIGNLEHELKNLFSKVNRSV